MKRIIKFLSLFLIVLISSVTLSCKFFKYDLSEAFYRNMPVQDRTQELTLLNNEIAVNSITQNVEYDVLIITDVHFGNENNGGNGPRREADWFAYLNTVNPETGKSLIDTSRFCICLGDVSEYGFLQEMQNYKQQLVEKLGSYNIPVYNVVGNHDLYNSGWKHWAGLLYPGTSFYKLETPGFSWYFLDSANGSLGGTQLELLTKNMSKDSKKKFVFTHVPVYANNLQYFVMQNSDERNKLISTCARYNTEAVIDGHTHRKIISDLGKFTEYNLPGFLSKSGFAVLHINEKDQTWSLQIKYF